MWYNTLKKDLREMITEESGDISSSRCGLWITVIVTVICIFVDVHLSLIRSTVQIPNTVYAILSTMFIVFSGWAAGKGIAANIFANMGNVVAGISSATQKLSNSNIGNVTEVIADKIQHKVETGAIKPNEDPI